MIVSPERVKKFQNSHAFNNNSENVNESTTPEPTQSPITFGAYEFFLLILTQFGYLPVAASLLFTTFFEPPKSFCHKIQTNISTSIFSDPNTFYSLLFEFETSTEEACSHASTLNFRLTFSVMLGGIVGSFISGYLADRCGRKSVTVGALIVLATSNLTCLVFASKGFPIALVIFFFKGLACGGYMVTNLVFILEAVQVQRTRLLVASLNGWPIGMMFTGFVGWISANWRIYFGCVCVTAISLAFLLYSRSFESVVWFDNKHKIEKAEKIRQRINKQNQRLQLPDKLSLRSLERSSNLCDNGQKDAKKLIRDENISRDISPAPNETKSQTYIDLFRHAEIRRPLFALLFSFMASSVVSFGFYFTADMMSGSRYLNLALMGALKFTLGLLPFSLSFLVPKKRIILGSVGAGCLACWFLAISCTWFNAMESILTTVLGVVITASMDPTWKVSHLYSVELFPTGVRNMARGICNVTARLGSIAGPLIILFRSYNPLIPYWMFAFILTFQWFVLLVYTPDSSENDLPQEMPIEANRSP